MKLHKKYQAAKLVLPIAGSILASGAVSQLPPKPIADGLRLLAGTASLVATGKAWCDATELEGMEAQNAADDAVRAAAIEADARCNASYYRRHPNHFRANKPVPEEWRSAWAASGGNPALLHRAIAPSTLTQPIAPIAQQHQPQTQTTQRHEQGVRGGSFAVDDGFVPQHPQAPVAQTPSLSNYSPPPQSSIAQVEYTPRLFDWQSFQRDPDLYPHVCVLGSTGNGKTSLQEWLARLIGNGNELVILTTKRKGMQWSGLPVTGLGRDFAPISQKWRSVESALNSRCADLDSAQSQPQIIIAIDELNDIIANSDLDLANVARAGREARLRLIVNSHSEGVDGLGLKGKNDIKACFVWVRLGQFAINHAQTLANKGLIENADIAWLKTQQRPCMVGDMVAQVPSLPEGWQSRLGGSIATNPTPPSNLVEPQAPPSFEATTPPGFDGSNQPGSMVGSSLNALSAALEPNLEPPTDIESRFAEMKNLGMNKAQICYMLWQVKKGNSSRYQMASDFYDRLNSKYQENSGDNAA